MSIESAKAYFERLKKDNDFAKKLSCLNNLEEKLTFIKSEGFDFTRDEISKLTVGLSESELDNVSAGAIYIDGKPPSYYLDK
jgi:predicted ribosomally synthesized peptide with nif11-like leader